MSQPKQLNLNKLSDAGRLKCSGCRRSQKPSFQCVSVCTDKIWYIMNEKANTPSEEAIATIGEVLLEALRHQGESESDIFERYATGLRSKIHKHSSDYSQRLLKGYRVLLEELRKKS